MVNGIVCYYSYTGGPPHRVVRATGCSASFTNFFCNESLRYVLNVPFPMSSPAAEDDLLRLRFLSKIEMVHVTWRVQ